MAASSRKAVELFVSKVPWTISTKEIRAYFAQFDQVMRCSLPFDKKTGFHRGFCWIRFKTEEGLEKALQKNQHMLEGAMLQVQKNVNVSSGKRLN